MNEFSTFEIASLSLAMTELRCQDLRMSNENLTFEIASLSLAMTEMRCFA